MGNFLFASVVTMLINQLTTTVDGVIVGHLVCPDALSAITLFIPVSLVITAMNTFVGIGATILAAKAMGKRDKAAVSGILSTALACVLIVGVCFAVLGFLFSDTVTSWLTTDPHLAPQLKPNPGCGTGILYQYRVRPPSGWSIRYGYPGLCHCHYLLLCSLNPLSDPSSFQSSVGHQIQKAGIFQVAVAKLGAR